MTTELPPSVRPNTLTLDEYLRERPDINEATRSSLRYLHREALAAAAQAERERLAAVWAGLMAEARAFEEWYGSRMGVNAWVGVDTVSGFYGGWSVEGDQLYDEWDESVMTTAEGETPEAVIADLIQIARSYRERRDAERAEERKP